MGPWRFYGGGYTDAPFRIESVSLVGGAETGLWIGDLRWPNAAQHSAPSWSADGALVASDAVPGEIRLIDANSSHWGTRLTPGRDPTFAPPGVRFTP